MQSSCPHIIKHFIPLSFSKQAVDMPTSRPKQEFVPTEDNPLQNFKLKQMDKKQNPEFVLTFANQTHKTYKPKKQLTYRQLFGSLKEEQQKMRVIIKAVKKNQIVQNLSRERRGQTREERGRTGEVVRPRTMTVGRRRIRERQSEWQIDNNSHSTFMRNIHTSNSTGRLWRTKSSVPGQILLLPESSSPQNKTQPLRIRGSKAPGKEMVDHLKRHSLKQLHRLEFV